MPSGEELGGEGEMSGGGQPRRDEGGYNGGRGEKERSGEDSEDKRIGDKLGEGIKEAFSRDRTSFDTRIFLEARS